jgi:hypothetical protein
MSILSDISRCHDARCPERDQCRRWTERETGRAHAATLNPHSGGPCPERIPPGQRYPVGSIYKEPTP